MTVFLIHTKQEVMEVLTGPERRRRWSAEEKLAMVRESFEPVQARDTLPNSDARFNKPTLSLITPCVTLFTGLLRCAYAHGLMKIRTS